MTIHAKNLPRFHWAIIDDRGNIEYTLLRANDQERNFVMKTINYMDKIKVKNQKSCTLQLFLFAKSCGL